MNVGVTAMTFVFATVSLIFMALGMAAFLQGRRLTEARKRRLETEVYPKFEAEFGCRPDSRGYRDRVKERMALLALLAGEWAVYQEVELITIKDNSAYHKKIKARVDEAKAKWGAAHELIREVDYDLFMYFPHWSDVEPYRSHQEKNHADLS